jgi:hypothetical protein
VEALEQDAKVTRGREGERDVYQLSTTRDWTSFSPSAAEHMVEDSAATKENYVPLSKCIAGGFYCYRRIH